MSVQGPTHFSQSGQCTRSAARATMPVGGGRGGRGGGIAPPRPCLYSAPPRGLRLAGQPDLNISTNKAPLALRANNMEPT
eukprot:3598857-Prymnesium_polylepis.1